LNSNQAATHEQSKEDHLAQFEQPHHRHDPASYDKLGINTFKNAKMHKLKKIFQSFQERKNYSDGK